MRTPNDHLDVETLSAFLDGELGAAESAAVREHLTACDDCASLLADIDSVAERVASLPEPPEPEGGWATAARRAAEASRNEAAASRGSGLRRLALAASAFLAVVLVGWLVQQQVDQGALAPASSLAPDLHDATPMGSETKELAEAASSFAKAELEDAPAASPPARAPAPSEPQAVARRAPAGSSDADRVPDLEMQGRQAAAPTDERALRARGGREARKRADDAGDETRAKAEPEGAALGAADGADVADLADARERDVAARPACSPTDAPVVAAPGVDGLEVPEWLTQPRATPTQVLAWHEGARRADRWAEVRLVVGRGGEVVSLARLEGDPALAAELELAMRSQRPAPPVTCRGQAVDAVVQARYVANDGGWTGRVVVPSPTRP